MGQDISQQVQLNDVLVDFSVLQLRVKGDWQAIEARQMALLKLLYEHRGKPVSRQQILDSVWPDLIVSDNSISQAITKLRKQLGDQSDHPKFIRTVSRKGYQLVAEIRHPQLTKKQRLKILFCGRLGSAP